MMVEVLGQDNMKYLRKFNESINTILDTVKDILVEIDNDIDGWSAKAWMKYEGENLPKDDLVVVIQREGEYSEEGKNEWQIIREMRIPNEINDTIKRLISFMSGYNLSIIICDNDSMWPNEIIIDTKFENGRLVTREEKDGKIFTNYITELWMNEFIRIEFTK